MASQAPAGENFDIGGTFGIAYVGAMIAMALYGITTLQSYLYYMYYPKDRATLKLLVATIWALETLQVALVCHSMYHYLISQYANPLALGIGTWSLYVSILCNVLIATLVQLFFAVRVHILSNSMWWLSILIMVTVLAHLAFGLETVIKMLILKELSKLPTITLNAALPFAITAVFPDVLIAISLCYFLHSVKSGFRGTNALLNTLMIYAVNRCLLTSVVAIVEVVLFKTIPGSFYFLAVDFCIGKLYANSLLATLNTRQALRGRGYESDSLSIATPSSRSIPTPQFGSGLSRRTDPVELSDLRGTWRSNIRSQGSADSTSVPGLNSEIHRIHRSEMQKDELLDVSVSTPGEVGLEDEERDLELGGREAPQKVVTFDS
ncbi:uncharacterized protein FOMMEDRAFT_107176 [Fomitiporia mediterranea MF3/22]|uniref:uncharacterized protein n=1 Tax=Fomitiporia mediterranea (strain MF3/22) TaxID=694068 RepID=UPI0004407390|nr:uncharacterized protein FOMMEDRAFT_107176 [Fomitiporia mediterranea MF3/22]EJD04445.1 hypothetical protein FOMMEDRAFT_107176 [Fomitiporia mediterranea MF3/22]